MQVDEIWGSCKQSGPWHTNTTTRNQIGVVADTSSHLPNWSASFSEHSITQSAVPQSAVVGRIELMEQVCGVKAKDGTRTLKKDNVYRQRKKHEGLLLCDPRLNKYIMDTIWHVTKHYEMRAWG